MKKEMRVNDLLIKTKFKAYMVLPLLPIIAVMVYCWRYGASITNYFLPNSQWNDEVVYYKTIEGIIHYGIPKGYFGYNESHAIIGTFGAWSPIIYVFDSVWGKIFGWNYFSPIIARMFFAVLSFWVYAILCKPNCKETVCISLFLISFSLYTRYLVSQMADPYMTSLLVIFLALYECHTNTNDKKHHVIIAFIVTVLVLMRPYYVLLWLAVVDFKAKKRTMVFDGLIAVISLIASVMISRYMTAPYFSSLINLDWLRLLIQNPGEGIRNVLSILADAISLINNSVMQAFLNGDSVGLQYFIFYLLTVVLLILGIMNKAKLRYFPWVAINVILWFAIVLLYDVNVGSRHLMPFIVIEGLVIAREKSKYIIMGLVVVTCYLCLFRCTDSYLMACPTYSESLDIQLKGIEEQWAVKEELSEDDKWKNTVIWVLSDVDGAFPWQTLYALPPGMGINLCNYNYVTDNFFELKPRYIACTAEGEVSRLCNQNGYRLVVSGNDMNMCIYEKPY